MVDSRAAAHVVKPGMKPTLEQSWDAITKTVDELDEDLVKGYKEDIDTLLVFAGLFSAVVTAFTIESYQWLQENPAETTVELLRQIAQQMSTSSQSSPAVPPPPHFTPSSSVIRINTFWFLSLILALVDALFGLLCKQWIREHKRQINTRTPGQALALRWLRYQSFDRWHVHSILASLSILLELALFSFFAGLLELLWTRHSVPFSIALVIVGLAVLFYLTTTIVPGVSIIKQVFHLHPSFASAYPLFYPRDIARLPTLELVCPYKSPQSWLIFRLVSTIYRLPGCKRLLHSFLPKGDRNWDSNVDMDDLDRTIAKNISNISSWSSLDLSVIQRFSSIKRCPDLYELKGFQWLVQETQDIPSMIPHLKNVIAELPRHLVMPTLFGQWVPPDGQSTWSATDVDSALDSPRDGSDDSLFSDQSSPHDLAIVSQIICLRHLMTTYGDYQWASGTGDELVKVGEELWGRILRVPGNSRLIPAFPRPQELLTSPSTEWRGKLLSFYVQYWGELDVDLQVSLAERLYSSVIHFLESSEPDDVGSTLLASRYGLDFLTSLNHKLYETKDFFEWEDHAKPWMDVLRHARRIHQLPPLYFKPFLGYFPISSDSLKEVLDDPSTCVSVFVPLLESYKQCWATARPSRKEELVKMLSVHINQDSAIAFGEPEAPDLDEEQPSPTSPLLQSQSGLDFLIFVNEKLAEDHEFHYRWKRHIIGPWVDTLERVRVLSQLPSGLDFKPIPKRYWVTDEIVGWYKPRTETGQIDNEAELAGWSRCHEAYVDSVTGEKRKRTRIGGGPWNEARTSFEIEILATSSGNGDQEGGEMKIDTDIRATTRQGAVAGEADRIIGGPGAEGKV
ncbi:hypothetical protein E1B28_000337 [Marasmius oreades]|uniref:DUF6535 domain-containing protein n=1 Tax=Marasmius oreades TaxID=181124 RepID=A0A9P7V135_9AGAR|nr:uncharacterized protein E1B28_000337 [Marasmius oreades]KAG7098379.1 hypothetical protein E1B28_000337 [Marasmius oreades]